MNSEDDVVHAVSAWDRQRGNYIELLDLKIEQVGGGRARMRLPFRAEVTNGIGAIHGGAIVSLAETTFYLALVSIFGREQDTAAATLTCNFLAPPVPPHDLIAEAHILKPGRRLVYGEVYVRCVERVVTHVTFNFLNTPHSAGDRGSEDHR